MGDVYAMKEIPWTNLTTKEKHNLVSEISLQKCNNSPYIIRYYESYIDNNYLYIISEYAENGDMTSYRSKHPDKVTDAFVAKTLIDLSLGLSYLHKNNIVHRDIKPRNILINGDRTALIGDLGVARFFPESNLLDSLTGSPVCTSPEMCSGSGYNEKTDIWSLGCVIYYLLKGVYPYTADNIFQLYMRIMNEPYNPIELADSIFYKEWNSILEKLLDKNPYTRYRASVICQEPFLLKFINTPLEDIQKKLHSTNAIGENIWELYNRILSKNNEYTDEELTSIIDQINEYSPKKTVHLIDTVDDTIADSSPRVSLHMDTPPMIPKLRLSPIIQGISSKQQTPTTTARRSSGVILPPLSLPSPVTTTPRVESYRKKGSVFFKYKVVDE
jgi:serine/threonine protein kinase